MESILEMLRGDSTPLIMYYVGMALMLIVVVSVVFLYAYYNKLLSRLPDAVKFKELQSKINILESKKEELSEEIEKQEEEKSINRGILEEVRNAKQWLQDNQMTIPQLENEITKNRNEYDKVLKLLVEEQEKLQTKRQELQDAEQSLADKRADLAVADRSVEAASRELSQLKEKVEQQIQEIDENRKELNDLDLKRKSAQMEYERLESELKKLKEKIADAETTLNKLKNEKRTINQSLEKLKAEQATVEGVVDGYNSAIDKHHKTFSKQMKELENKLTVLTPDLDTRLEDLYRPVVADPLPLLKDLGDEDDWLNEFQETLAKNGIIYPLRSIKAFHTSLKIADISPIVVLAGISGTGKSLLPQLYAKAIGMHFLPISVQPRWDGPQDLFGFYNYMENRFKATELTRLLWQQDQYNNPDPSELMTNSMTLVLLDEMNLARVEYYFSDMLSKLELRRNIDPEEDDSRSIAEIELEAGSLHKNEFSKRLFVGSNILFVGTMNEDETTQTLSDKVLDRSNMLRFGKPKKNEIQPDIESLMYDLDISRSISADAWESWAGTDLSSTNQEKLNNYLENLNSAMETVGRPFGHRVHQAITQYIANYPGVETDDASFNAAIADQIEMKILPKLNGLEQGTGKADMLYDTLSDIISGLDDDQLWGAFNTVIDQENAFFEWKGLTREEG